LITNEIVPGRNVKFDENTYASAYTNLRGEHSESLNIDFDSEARSEVFEDINPIDIKKEVDTNKNIRKTDLNPESKIAPKINDLSDGTVSE
jgi:hypothetical protein